MRILLIAFLFSSVFYGNIACSSSVEEPEDVVSVCVREAQKYIDFEKDYLDFCKNLIPTNSYYQYNMNDIIDIVSKISEKRALILSIENGENSLDYVLCVLLKERLFDIKCKDEERKYHSYEILDPERRQNKDEAAATFFQFNNLMIKLLFQSTRPDQLSVKTRRQIRLSPSLWQLLTGETDDLGHPDQTKEDLMAFNNYEDKSEVINLTHYGLGQNGCFTKRHEVTPYERNQYDERCKKKIPDLPYPDWLNPFKMKEDFEKDEIFEEFNQDDEQVFISNNYNIIDSNRNDDLRVEVDFPSKFVNESLFEGDLLSEQKQPPEDQDKFKSSQEKAVVITDLQQGNMERDLTEGTKEDTQTEGRKKAEKSQEKNVSIKKTVRDIWAPRGMRIFHSEQSKSIFQTEINLEKLPNRHKKTLESIFDSRGYTTVSYGKFKSLWKAINGTNSVKEDTKSSHKVLLDSNGIKVSGIFSHGDSMCYTKRTIPYIRYALQLVGFEL